MEWRAGRLGVPASCFLKDELLDSINGDWKGNREKRYQISSDVHKVGRYKDKEFWEEITEIFETNPSESYVVYVWIRKHRCLPWRINYPSSLERLWSQEAWMSEALPSSRKSFFLCFFSLCPCSLCEAPQSLSGIKTKKLVHKCNQTPACLTINLAKHSRSASKLSDLRAPLLSQHCSIKLL